MSRIYECMRKPETPKAQAHLSTGHFGENYVQDLSHMHPADPWGLETWLLRLLSRDSQASKGAISMYA